MNRPMVQHGFTRGCRLWLCLVLSLGMAIAVTHGLVLATQAATAKECHRETPLPAEVRLSAPGPQVPEAVAQFAGVWNGAFLDNGKEVLCHTLVVEEVYANGLARVIVSLGTTAEDQFLHLPHVWRVTGRVVDGELRLHLPLGERLKFAYRVAGETLSGTFEGPDGGTVPLRLTGVADVHQVGCGSPAGGLPPAPTAAGPRDRLTAAELLGADASSGPVHNAYFMPIGQAAPALHPFKGTVTVAPSTMLRARHGCSGLSQTLPSFTVAFFTQGEHLVPVVRDILHLPGIILSPGQVWSEPGDNAMSRASFPFVLTNQDSDNRNATHFGLATFLYNDARVSSLRFQVVKELNPLGLKYDGWGQAPMTYTPGPIADEAVVQAQFAAEVQQQTPIQPWSALPVASGAPGLEGFDGDTRPEEISVSGLIIDGVIYLRGCDSRAGPYPYCRQMRHGVWSVTKSLGAAVTLLRLAQTYGEQILALKITDYVTVTAAHDGWAQVTFADALNMATGIGDNWPQREPNRPMADATSLVNPKWGQWIRAQTAKDKLDVSFSYGQYPWGPREVLRYNGINTFVLPAAMDSFLKRQAGPQAQLWAMVVAEVFQPIGIFHAPMMHTQEADGGRGIPFLAVGLYPTIDDVAKLTTLFQHGGQHQGQQLLHAGKLAEALYQTNALGLRARLENRFGIGRYQLSFWSVPYRTATGCVFQIPHMGGLGGNLVVLLPNGVSAFRFADGHHYDVDTLVLAGEAIRPFPCPPGSGGALPPARQALSASDLRAELTGHTFYADDWHLFLAADGVL
jgi:hypothetical protein